MSAMGKIVSVTQSKTRNFRVRIQTITGLRTRCTKIIIFKSYKSKQCILRNRATLRMHSKATIPLGKMTDDQPHYSLSQQTVRQSIAVVDKPTLHAASSRFVVLLGIPGSHEISRNTIRPIRRRNPGAKSIPEFGTKYVVENQGTRTSIRRPQVRFVVGREYTRNANRNSFGDCSTTHKPTESTLRCEDSGAD